MDLERASDKLSQLDIQFNMENLAVEVLWFRAMIRNGTWIIHRHTHSSFEFHFIYSGACRVMLDSGEFRACKGDFYLTPPGVFHQQESIENEDLIEFCIHCDLRLLDRNETEAACLYHIFQNASCEKREDLYGAIPLFQQALSEADTGALGFYNTIKGLIIMMLTASARALKPSFAVDFSVPVRIRKNEHRFLQIEKFIDDNINNPIRAENIADAMFLSSKQVGRIIRQYNGMTTKEFIIQKKLDKAKQLLKESELTIKEISDLLGFSSEYYFSQFFKKHDGYPPKIFRQNTKPVG